ncbi:MAG: transglycosylase domain-containing protein, partial [Pseudomonadota bacterium]
MSASSHGRRPTSGAKRRLVADRRTPAGGQRRTASGSGGGKRPPARKPAKRRTRKTRPQRGGLLGLVQSVFRWLMRMIFRLVAAGTVAVLLLLGAATAYYYGQLPDVAAAVDQRARGSVTMLDRNGQVFAWRGEQFGGVVTPDTASEHLTNAVVATEDRRFYRHLGVSPRGIASAVRINLREGRGPLEGHGGSTITQQVAKLLCLGVAYDPEEWETEAAYEQDCRRTTLWRKIQEMPFSFAMELRYTKDEILTIYFNRAYLGAGARGFEGAAQRYFGIAASDLEPQQAAMLAGLLVAPSYYAPTRSLERAQNRAATILRLMGDQGYLSEAEVAAAQANPATLSAAAEQNTGGAFADWIMSSGPDFLTRDTTEDVIIRTTFDPEMQAAAEAALQNVFENQVREGSEAQAAIVVMSADGAVRAMVGGRDTQGAGLFNRATQALRQTGSAFKPFVYATALDLGYRFDDPILDAELTIDVPGSGPYSPRKFENHFYVQVTLTEALSRSLK